MKSTESLYTKTVTKLKKSRDIVLSFSALSVWYRQDGSHAALTAATVPFLACL